MWLRFNILDMVSIVLKWIDSHCEQSLIKYDQFSQMKSLINWISKQFPIPIKKHYFTVNEYCITVNEYCSKRDWIRFRPVQNQNRWDNITKTQNLYKNTNNHF